jgi:hypothetical protein
MRLVYVEVFCWPIYLQKSLACILGELGCSAQYLANSSERKSINELGDLGTFAVSTGAVLGVAAVAATSEAVGDGGAQAD